MAEHRLAFRKVLHSPACRLRRSLSPVREQVQRREFTLNLPRFRPHRRCRKPISDAWRSQLRRSSPLSTSRFLARVISAARSASFGVLHRQAFFPGRHRLLDLRPPRRELLDHLPRHPCDLEPPVRMCLLDPVTQVLETLRQLRPVDRPHRHLVPVEPVVDHGPPLPVLTLHHVGNHGMSVALRVQVPGGVVPEGRRHHFLAGHTDHGSARLVLHTALDGVALHPC